jgi:hypothetical protein
MLSLLLLLALLESSSGLQLKTTAKTLISKFDTLEEPGDLFACPSSLAPLTKVYRSYGPFVDKKYYINAQFATKYDISRQYVDFTIAGTEKEQASAYGQFFFQLPATSFIYERGYRQQFETVGFPGIDKEFAEIDEYFVSANAKTVLDLSCGSGFMTRRLIKSGNYDRVLAADLSPSMLIETRSRCRQDTDIGKSRLPTLVRCDSAQLPFRSNSLDAIHAGAAMHCWPRINQVCYVTNL